MLRLGCEREQLNIVDDQVGGPTTSIELANATRTIADGLAADTFGSPEAWAGVYHMTCAGATSWCGFASAIFANTTHLRDGRQPLVNPIPTSSYPCPAERPLQSVLSNQMLKDRLGLQLPPWDAALQEVIRQIQ